MNENQSNTPYLKEEGIDIRKYLWLVLRNWFWFLSASIVGLGTAYIINRYSDPMYRVSMSIIIEDEEGDAYYGGSRNLIEGLDAFQQGKKIENEIAILHSYNIAKKTIEKLDFTISYFGEGRIKERPKYKLNEFYVELDTTHYQQPYKPIYITPDGTKGYQLEIENSDVNQFMRYGEVFENENFRFRIMIRDTAAISNPSHLQYFFYMNTVEGLTARYRGKLSVNRTTEEGSVLQLSSAGYVPQKEILFINKLAETYIQSGLEEKNKIAESTIAFIDDQLSNISDSLTKAENDLQNFRLSKEIIDIEQEGSALFSQLEDLQKEKAREMVHRKYYKYLREYLANPDNETELLVPALVGVREQVLSKLVNEINHLYKEKQSLKFATRKNNPKLNLIDQQIRTTQRALVENVSNLMKKSKMVIEDIDERIEEINKEIRKLPVNERQLINIERKFNLNDNIYTYLLEKRAEAGIKKASTISDARVLDRARSSSVARISPKYQMNYILGLIIGFMVPLIIILLKDYFNTRIVDKKDIEDNTQVPVLGVVGHNTLSSEFVVKNKPKSSLAESFRSVQTNLQYLLLEETSKVINITSAMTGEGKTFSSINLAAIMANANKKTLLVGLDLRKPKIHTEFNVENNIGLSTYLINKHEISDILIETETENLTIVPSGPTPVNPAKLLETDRFQYFIDYIRQHYDYIIFDTPPAALVSDAIVLARYADANIFVIRQNYSNKTALELINDLHRNNRLHNMSILVNDVRIKGYYGGYGYSYGYGYGYGYGYAYGYGYGDSYYEDEGYRLKLKDRLLILLNLKK